MRQLTIAAVFLAALPWLVAGCDGESPTGVHSPAETPDASLELTALKTFYSATNGPEWTNSDNWLSDAPLADWHGISVDERGSVVGIDLRRNRLSGEIPPELAGLTNLESLRLNRNQLSGPIPPELGNLSNLTSLVLSGNPLGGAIPPELGRLSNLELLSLAGAQLSGEIPSELGRLANLELLLLNDNQLSGEIPPALGALVNLTTLELRDNDLTGSIPAALGNMSSLQQLNLHRNQLSGAIPPELGNLSNLLQLDVRHNQLSGEIPPELGGLSGLTKLSLHRNQLNGAIPAELGTLVHLRELQLDDNQLSGAIPAELGALTDLELLSLGYNQLSGEIPPELGNLVKLTELRLQANRLTGVIPPQLGNLVNLTALSLGHNRLNGEIPRELVNLVNLIILTLDWNQLSGAVPPGLATLSDLTRLSLAGNRLSGEIPLELQGSVPVRVAPVPAASHSTELGPAVRLVAAFGGRKFDRPIDLGAYPLGPSASKGLFVAEQDGYVLLLQPEGGEVVNLLDIRDRVSTVGSNEGLLSVALDPRFAETGHLWLYYTAAGSPRKTRLSRFSADLADLRRVDPQSELIVLEVAQPSAIHHGGAIRFGPDGMLYLGLGDSEAPGESQRLQTLWGSIIRIDVRQSSVASPYAVPPDNPFVGVPGIHDEIWAYGFRNPWRMAFDPLTGVLWAGDVGNQELEEIDLIEAGGNYGWAQFEGTRCVSPSVGCEPYGFVAPLLEYRHQPACAVVGGVVYRGRAVSALAGHYLFADYCSGQIWALPIDGGEPVEIALILRRISSFGLDAEGEVYVLTFGEAALRIAPEER